MYWGYYGGVEVVVVVNVVILSTFVCSVIKPHDRRIRMLLDERNAFALNGAQ
jgi:hypothetical protein